MAFRLLAALYDDPTYAGAGIAEAFDSPADIGIRWSIPGGLQRIELTVKAHSRYDAYKRYRDHLGYRIALYDNFCDRYIGGQIYEVIPDGRHVTYICSGPWKRTYDGIYNVSNFPATGDTDVIIKDILTDAAIIDDTDQTNIDGSNVAIGGWNPKTTGVMAGDAIKELAAIGDNSNNIMDFYFVDQRFSGGQMQKPLPYLKSRSATADPDWIFSIEDLASNGLTLARHIWDIKNFIYVGYGRLAGTDDGADNDTLVDGGEDFVSDGVEPGDRVTNLTDNAVFVVDTVAPTILTFTDGATGSWNNSDKYSIKLRELKRTGADGSATSDYWTVRYQVDRPEMDETQATQYRDQLYATYRDAQLQQAFVIGAPTIRDFGGSKWPLWRALMGTSFYFRADNLFPEASVFGDSDNRASSFMAVAMDYKYSTNTLRIVPSTNDSRLDSLLNQAGIINGQIISTETAWRNRNRAGE